MRIRHLLFPTELSSLVIACFLDKDRFVRRNTDTQSAPRRPGPHEPGPEAERRTRLMHQTLAEGKCFFVFSGRNLFATRCAAATLLPQFEQQFAPGNYQTKWACRKIGSCADDARTSAFDRGTQTKPSRSRKASAGECAARFRTACGGMRPDHQVAEFDRAFGWADPGGF